MIGISMFVIALVLIIIGSPVAFSFGGAAVIVALLTPDIGLDIFNLLPFRIYGIMNNFNLIAVPLFIFMGLILEKSKIAEDLLISFAKLFGRVRGGLAISTIIVGSIIAASTGIVGASVVMMSLISLPVMLRYGYDKKIASGVIASSGTLGQIVPPSIILIILGDVMSIDVGELFRAAIIPSLILIGLYIVYIVFLSFILPKTMPSIPTNSENSIDILKDLLIAILAPLTLMGIVLGTIFSGVATPTESAAFGTIGAILLTILKGTFNFKMLQYSMNRCVKLTSMIFMILIGATAFSLVFNESGGSRLVEQFFRDDIANQYIFILLSMVIIFLLGFFLDFLEICFIVVPILKPIVDSFGIDPTWFTLLIALNLQASFLTPPFGFSLFYLKGAAKDLLKTEDIYKGVVPFIILQIIALLILIIFPSIVI
jgi:tripartite ATP-independent transporter DctM subunit